uniref:Elongator complex protein 1 n=1 Tax=Anopheles atroparvus TaxID=41427 RepID=A0AAG5CYA7_ANOAO
MVLSEANVSLHSKRIVLTDPESERTVEEIFRCTSEEDKHEFYSSRDDVCRGDIETLLRIDAGYKNIIAIEHLALTNELCCASSDGNVWSYKLDTGTTEEVALCQHGIEAMQWSPDQEVVVFVDKQLNVVTMIGSEYEPINEVQLKDDTFGDRAFMSVGWGKKETQFHGSEGKAAAKKQTQPKAKDDVCAEDRPYTCISWRADGEFFAVSFQTPCGIRAFKVFNKEGALQYTSERCQGLYSALAWQPSGQWIAVPQINAENNIVIALFEKNGLRHREIPTPLIMEDQVVSLRWSPDSEVLAVHFYTTHEALDNKVFLYVMGNYHWYLKQCLVWPEGIYDIQWDQRHSAGKTLHAFTRTFFYERIRFDFRVDRSVGHGDDDEAMVAVIDGDKLLLSSFRRSIIPPPMCSYTLTINSDTEDEDEGDELYINAVGFIRSAGRWASVGKDLSPNAFFVVDSGNKITFYDVTFTEEGKDGGTRRTVLTGVKTLLSLPPCHDLMEPILESSDILIHSLWVNPDNVVLCCNNFFVSLNLKKSKQWKEQYFDWIEHNTTEPFAEHETIACAEALGSDSVLIELTSGRLMRVEGFTVGQPGVESFSIKPHSILPEFCEQLFIDQQRSPADVYAFSQTRRNLYRNGTLLASEVTSVFLSGEYLLFTTIGELKFVPLGDKLQATTVGERRLERGSKLVTVVSKASRTIFQLPRGNLEAISPRVLSLCLIAKHLEALEYHDAFDIMRKERINLNLLVDHDAERFLAHLDTHFLAQITNVSWLNLFITDLTNQDVCRTMYESNYPGRQQLAECSPSSSGYTVEGKVQFICERLLGAMDSDPTVLTLPKITCHVKQGQLEKALSLIWMLKRDNPTPEPAEEALRYLLYLVEVNVLYDAALGMYDFGLVLFVATKSQKDPKEYLPFLNELKRLDENYRKYRIDCHLKRYDRALAHISRCEAEKGRLQEVLELIDTHNLYTTAIECYRMSSNEEYLRKIYERYADQLRKGGKHAEASMMYERMGDIQQAINSARHALDWRRVLRLSARSMDPEAVRPVFRSLVPALVETGEYDAAATIAHEQLNDVQLAVDCLLKGPRYERALLMVVSGGPEVSELYETIREHLRQYLSSFITTLAADRDQFLHQKGRLAAIREAQEKARLAAAAGGADEGDADGEGDCGDCDLFSDSSTIASSRHTSSTGRSGKSHRSSKNRRKHERKLLNLKEGNPFEDIALIDALHALVLRVCSVDVQNNVRSICQVALELSFDAEAQAVQRDYGALFQLIRYSLDAIWIPEMIVPGSPPTASSGEVVGEGSRTFQTPADVLQVQNAQRFALIKPHQRYKPDIQSIAWQWDVLK